MNAIAQMLEQNEVAQNVVAADKAEKAAAKKPRTVRAAQKPVEKKESAVTKTAKVIGVKYVITGGARPAAGKHLYAFTAAVIHATGMDKGAAVDRAVLTDIIGARAVQYHTSTTMAFAINNDGITLNGEYGRDYLNRPNRAYDPKDFDAYLDMLQSGKADDRLVKNAGMIRAVKAA